MSAGHAYPPAGRWWTESISDGGAHYGALQPDTGAVHAVCGRVFAPLPHPWTGRVEPQHQPADPTHGCRACKAVHQLASTGSRPTPM